MKYDKEMVRILLLAAENGKLSDVIAKNKYKSNSLVMQVLQFMINKINTRTVSLIKIPSGIDEKNIDEFVKMNNIGMAEIIGPPAKAIKKAFEDNTNPFLLV